MRLAQLLFKPKWQDKDATVRRAAVASGDDPDMLDALPRLLREDEDAGVRLAALKRLNDYENWRERSTGDAEKSVRDAARGVYIALLCAATTKPALTRRIAELETLSADELERVALGSVDRDLRAAALTYIHKAAILADRAVADPDAKLRLAALERVADVNLLERIAERARKIDKNVAKRARERVEALRIGAGDSRAIADKARALCEAVHALMRSPHAQLAAELASIDTTWNSLGAQIPAELAARYNSGRVLAVKALEHLQNPLVLAQAEPVLAQDEPAPAAAIEPEPVAREVTPTPELTAAVASRARFDAALAAAEEQARVERDRRKQMQRDLEAHLPEFSAAIDAGNAGEAHRVHALLEAGVKALAEPAPALQRQLNPLLTRYAELKRWQHWSNNQRRRVLCADIETLAGSGLHPDAVATRVREARDEWQRMNVAEGLADSEASAGISRRFQALCQQALRPTKGYFSKRKQVRKSHEEEIATLLEKIAALGADSSDWKAIAQLRAEASTALRGLDAVPPQSRTALAKQLKDAIAQLQTRSETHEREIQAEKQRLIDQATALSARGEGATAAREARDLQKKWTTLGNGRRNTDQRQWREFRAACDAVFSKLDAARKEREVQAADQRVQIQQLVEEFEGLAADDGVQVDAAKARLRELETRWQTQGTDDRALAQRQRQAREAIGLRIKDAARRARLARYTHALNKYTFLRALESGAPSSADWHALPASIAAFDVPLEARLQRALAMPCESQENDDARDLLVRLEFSCGLESPAEDRQRRMNHQVARLSSRLRSGAADTTPERELDTLLGAWFAQPAQTPALELRFERAARAALEALP